MEASFHIRYSVTTVEPCPTPALPLIDGSQANRERGSFYTSRPPVLSTTRFPEAVGISCYRMMIEFLGLQNFAEFFAELCATDAPIAPIPPLYSVENMCTPSFTIRLLTEGL